MKFRTTHRYNRVLEPVQQNLLHSEETRPLITNRHVIRVRLWRRCVSGSTKHHKRLYTSHN